jgi:hypothetical protein
MALDSLLRQKPALADFVYGSATLGRLRDDLMQQQVDPEDFVSDAHRLALELECLLLDTKDTTVLSRWWDSAQEALDLHRELVNKAWINDSK